MRILEKPNGKPLPKGQEREKFKFFQNCQRKLNGNLYQTTFIMCCKFSILHFKTKTMKKAIFLLLFASASAIAQVGINTSTPDASAALDVESTTGGLLPPRMSSAQRELISNPADGLIVYQTDESNGIDEGLFYYNESSWKKIRAPEKEYTWNVQNVLDGEWVTIAKLGDSINRLKLRGDALFELTDTNGSRHHTIIFRAGSRFGRGHYIDVLSSSWYNIRRFNKLRIVYGGTYDGAVIQVQLNQNNTSSQYISLRIIQNAKFYGALGGWTTEFSEHSVNQIIAENSPTVYLLDGSTSGFGATYSTSKEVDLNWNLNNENASSISTQNVKYTRTVNVNNLIIEKTQQAESDESGEGLIVKYNGNTKFNVPFTGNSSLDGNLNISGSIVSQSDLRLKTNIVSLGATLSKLLKIDGKTYTLKKNGEKKMGVLAQNIREVFPELVSEDNEGILSVDYQGLIPVLINALKEQDQKFRLQEERFQAQQEKFQEQEERLKALERMLSIE